MRGAWLSFIVAGLASFALGACQTMSAEECAAADWGGLGYGDGAAGNEMFARRQESCARKGFAADYEAYRAGNAQGVRAYCTPQNGFRRGLNGTSYGGFCPPDLAGEFTAAHADGYHAYEVMSALRQAESEQQRLENRRREIDDEIRRDEDALRAATVDDERTRLRNELGRLNDERRRVNDDIRTQMQEVRWRTGAVDRARFEIGSRWGAW